MNLSKIKITALSLALFLVLSFVLSPVYAIEAGPQLNSGTVDSNSTIITALSESDIPEVLDFNEAKNKGHISRERELEEDLFTAIFANDDGTKTMYIFGAPIKYIDSNGEVKDKSTKLSLSGTELITADNDVTVSFPQYASQGISVSKENINISMAPNYVSASANARIAEQTSKTQYGNKVTYQNAFGSNIHLSYTATFSGVKEDIILDNYTDLDEFSFVINTNGLYMIKNSNGSCSFIDPSTDSVKAEMMQVFCVDASNQFGSGDIEITEVKANQKYIITVIPDKEFLQSETTVYPVTVDPTITVKTSAAVDDAAIYSGTPTTNYGSARTSTLGYVDSTYKKGELLVKFPYLASNNVFEQLYAADIRSATFSFYTTSSYSSTAIIEAYTSPIQWYKTSVTWNSLYPVMIIPTYISSVTTASYIGVQKNTMDVLSAVRGWTSGDYSPSKGILLVNANETDSTQARGFLNVEYALAYDSLYMPCLEIVHTNYGAYLEPQQTPVWCWVACARMASFIYADSYYSQAAAAVKVHLGISNMSPTAEQISAATLGGYPSDTAAALEYILEYQHSAYGVQYKIYSESVLRSLLDDSNPVIISRGRYSLESGFRWDGHAIVAIDYYYDTEINNYVYVILDPWPVNEGDVKFKTYSEICREIDDENNTIVHIWDGVTVYQKGNYSNTIDWQGFFQ